VGLVNASAGSTGAAPLSAKTARRFRSSVCMWAWMLLCVVTGSALGRRTGRALVTGSQGEVINDTLLAAGERVEIDGVVNGDLIARGRSISIRGAVRGNVFAWAKTIEINGTAEGSVVCFGQNLTVRGRLGQNLFSWSQF